MEIYCQQGQTTIVNVLGSEPVVNWNHQQDTNIKPIILKPNLPRYQLQRLKWIYIITEYS